MRKSTTLEDRIRVRAYFIAQHSGFTINPANAWLAAERKEMREQFVKRSAAAKKGAKTRTIRQTAATAQMTERLRSEQSAAKH